MGFLLLLGFFIIIIISFFSDLELSIKVKNVQDKIQKQSLLLPNNYELDLIRADLSTYGYLSKSTQNLIINALLETSTEFRIPVGLLHAIIRVESEYRFWIDHPPVIRKGQKVWARGLGGVMWYYWGEKLRKNKIAQNSSDLYLVDRNIKATGFILRNIIKSGKNINQENIMSYIQKKYYGANSKNYIRKMIKVTSDLWMNRMAKEIKFLEEELVDSLNTNPSKIDSLDK